MKKRPISWIRAQVKASGTKGVVFGLSGGIDSCVVAGLLKQALGKKRVLALILPIHSHKQDLEDARAIARKFAINTKTVNLSAIYDGLKKILPPAGKLAQMNLKPRLRMLVLYYFANKLNYLVCGTGNKAEIKVGYFTKYGDGAVDILPIGGLLKREVRTLARELKIPEAIISKPPTAGLWPGQTDEGEMGIFYSELDDIIERLENKKAQVIDEKKVAKVKLMMKRSEHKRQLPKICDN